MNKKLIITLIIVSVIGIILIGIEQQNKRQERIEIMMNELFY